MIEWCFLYFTLTLLTCVGWLWILRKNMEMISKLSRFKHQYQFGSGSVVDISTVLVLHNQRIELIQRSITSLLRQQGVQTQIILVDDCSNDENSLLIKELADQDSRIIYIKNLKEPKGWIGHNYAFELGQARADGQYILFSEVNIILSRFALNHAAHLMKTQELDHLALFPRIETTTFFESITLPLLFLLTKFRSFHAESISPESHQGTGHASFNMVYADSYRERGTHAAIRNSVFDECVLSQLMRRDGGRGLIQRAYLDVRLKSNLDARRIFSDAKKHFLMNSGRGAIGAYLMTSLLFLSFVLPLLTPVLLISGFIEQRAICVLLSLFSFSVAVLPTIGLLRIRSMLRFAPFSIVFYPVGAIFLMFAAMTSAFKYSIYGRVECDGREYCRGDISDKNRYI